MRSRLRNFCFTWNNPPGMPQGLDALKNISKYLVFQLEIGENGTPHVQGYCELDGQKSFKQLKDMYPAMHIERRYATASQAASYCRKEDTRAPGSASGPWEYGTISSQGRRKDVETFRDAIKEGQTMSELLDSHPQQVAQFPKFMNVVKSTMPKQIRLDLRVEVHYGDAGTGKTRQAFERFPDLYRVPVTQKNSIWFDGYLEDEVLLLDDFSGEFALKSLLNILDIYPVQVPIKGGFASLEAKRIIITTNKAPQDWYDWTNRSKQKLALFRRFHKLVYYEEGKDPVVLDRQEEETNAAWLDRWIEVSEDDPIPSFLVPNIQLNI